MTGQLQNELGFSERVVSALNLGESHFREFKSAWDRLPGKEKPREARLLCKDIAETLVAFANADGGELIVGVEDDGKITGIPHSEAVVSMMFGAPQTHVMPETPLPIPKIRKVKYGESLVLYFSVAKGSQFVHLTSDGRCLQRFDTESRPVASESIRYSREEQRSREYDREYVDGASVLALDSEMLRIVGNKLMPGTSHEKLLQYLDLAEYGPSGLQLRRAALLLFAREIEHWHPRSQVRVMRVRGVQLGAGQDYNIDEDEVVRGNVLQLLESAWELTRRYLVQTRFSADSLFHESVMYPEEASREALINAIAHRDYSAEGIGVEVRVYDDRMEVTSPGGLLTGITVEQLQKQVGVHQSRNAYIARVLREIGYMREMGEGMPRIFRAMKANDLVEPELNSEGPTFSIVLSQRSIFSRPDQEWLRAFGGILLSRDEQRVLLLGRDGHLITPNEIIRSLEIVDTEDYRKVVDTLQKKGLIFNALPRGQVRKIGAGVRRDVGRYVIRPPVEVERYVNELIRAAIVFGSRPYVGGPEEAAMRAQLSKDSPYYRSPRASLTCLGYLDEQNRPTEALTQLFPGRATQT